MGRAVALYFVGFRARSKPMMKLSEAIELGSTMLHPKPMTLYEAETKSGCAIGMAFYAIGAYDKVDFRNSIDAPLWWNRMVEIPCKCRQIPPNHCDLMTIVMHLFDAHVWGKFDWTFQQLLDWIKLVELSEPELRVGVEDKVCESVKSS
jgi:hypothetical protein